MFRFAAKLLMSRALTLEEGLINIYNTPVIMNPADYSVSLIHDMIGTFGYPKAHDLIYESAKKGTQEYSKALRRNTNVGGRELARLYEEIVTLGGYGVAKITAFNMETQQVVCRFDNSPIAKRYVELYGKTKFPIDIITNGLYAGSFNVLFNEPNESVETHCMAQGDPYCEFVYGPPEKISEIKNKLWARFGGVSK